MKRRHFLAAMGIAAPILLTPSMTSAFDLDLGLPGMTISTKDIKKAAKNNKPNAIGYEDVTPEQEYYLGRAVAALILKEYKPFEHKRGNTYINVMGNLLAQASDRPETFGGYHFQLLDTQEIITASAPGGFVFLSRGMLKCCKNEDTLAAILSHEIGHIQKKHPLQSVSREHLIQGISTMAIPGTSTMSKGTVSTLTKAFDGAVRDIMKPLTEKGYPHTLEEEADSDAVILLRNVGYDQHACLDILKTLEKKSSQNDKEFMHLHPAFKDRYELTERLIGNTPRAKRSTPRNFRFMSMTAGI